VGAFFYSYEGQKKKGVSLILWPAQVVLFFIMPLYLSYCPERVKKESHLISWGEKLRHKPEGGGASASKENHPTTYSQFQAGGLIP